MSKVPRCHKILKLLPLRICQSFQLSVFTPEEKTKEGEEKCLVEEGTLVLCSRNKSGGP